MIRVLLIADYAAMAAKIERQLREANFIVDIANPDEDGIAVGKLYDYDIITLDLTLPDIQVLRRLRAAQIRTPILVLSGSAEPDDKIKVLRCGADDFMTKPCHPGELIARIQAIVRRSEGHPHSTIRIGKLAVDLASRSVVVDNQPLHLTVKEYDILELLSRRKGTIVIKESFLDHLYGGLDEPQLKIINVFICKLRKKLKATGCDHYIKTVWDRGYVLLGPAEVDAALAPRPEAPAASAI